MIDVAKAFLSGLFSRSRREAAEPDDGGKQSEVSLQNNLDRALDYRREYYKYVIGIATALLAFTVSFPPQLSRIPEDPHLLFVGWAALGVAVLAGVRVHMVWAKFFVTFRKFDNRGQRQAGLAARRRLNIERRVMDALQMIGLIVGVSFVVLFTGLNLKHVAVKKDDAGGAGTSRKVEDAVAAPKAPGSQPPTAAPPLVTPPPVNTGKP